MEKRALRRSTFAAKKKNTFRVEKSILKNNDFKLPESNQNQHVHHLYSVKEYAPESWKVLKKMQKDSKSKE